VWIGPSGLVRRIVIHYRLSNDERGPDTTASVDLVTDLSGFGRRVRATAPPRDAVVTLDELVRLGE
jgi:hypothetical protein